MREDGTPYYVGKGKGSRAFVTQGHSCSPPPRNRIEIRHVFDESSAFVLERFLIAFYGRKDNGTGILRNHSDGGEGLAGHTFSQNTRDKIAASNRGQKRSSGAIDKIKAARAKQVVTPEHKAAISKGMKKAFAEGRLKVKETIKGAHAASMKVLRGRPSGRIGWQGGNIEFSYGWNLEPKSGGVICPK